jgi:hypothetical protein
MSYHRTSFGNFLIVERSGRWQGIYNDESLGSYVNPRQATEDLAGGHTFSPGPEIDTSKLGILHDIEEWEKGHP